MGPARRSTNEGRQSCKKPRNSGEVLRLGEHRLRQAVRASHIGIFDHDHLTDTIYWSPEQRDIFGFDRDEAITLSAYFDQVHPEDRDAITAAVRRAHDPQGDGLFDVENRIVCRNGSVRWLTTRSQTFFAGEGTARHKVRTVGAMLEVTEHHRLEEEKQSLVEVVQNSPDFIGIAGLDSRVLFVNKAGQQLVGLESDQQANSKSIFDYLPADEVARFRNEVIPAIYSGKAWDGEVSLKNFRTGELIPFEMKAFPILDAQRKVSAIANVSRDLRKRRLVQEETRKLARVVQNSPDFIGIAAPDGQGLFINRAGQDLVGIEEERSVTSTYLFDFLSPEQVSRVRQEILPTILSGKPWFGEVTFKHTKTGELIPFETRAFSITDDHGAVTAIATVARDIRKRKRRDLILRQAEEKYRGIFDNAVLGIFQSTPEGRYLSVNRAMAQMHGYASPQDMMAAVTDIEHQEYVAPSRRRDLIRALEEHGTVTNFEFEIYRKDGTRGSASLNVRSVRDEHGKILYYEGTQEDISQRKRLEAQYQQAQKLEAVGRLAGGVAHDFNNMLGVIIGFCDLTLELRPANPVLRNTSQIKQAAVRAANLTKQLLAFSRQQLFYPRVLDLNKIVDGSSEMIQRMVGEDIRLSFNLGATLGMVKADPGQIEQILMNLCINARDAMPKGGKIVVETGNVTLDEYYVQRYSGVLAGSYVMLAVSDTGSGIPKETLPFIFEPFFTTKGAEKGTGLGLATVYGIVKQSNGYIDVYSEVNVGTTFKIYVPRVDEDESVLEPAREAEGRGGSETILLVEDEAALLEVAATLLAQAGYKVLKAENAPAALSLAQISAAEIDLVVTDVIMPGMSGVELCNRLRKLRRAIRMVYVSGHVGDQLNQYLQLGPEMTVLEKPYTKESLLTKVRSVLDR